MEDTGEAYFLSRVPSSGGGGTAARLWIEGGDDVSWAGGIFVPMSAGSVCGKGALSDGASLVLNLIWMLS